MINKDEPSILDRKSGPVDSTIQVHSFWRDELKNKLILFIVLALASMIGVACSPITSVDWTDDGTYCFATEENFWLFDRAVDSQNLSSIALVIEDPSTIQLAQGTQVRVIKKGGTNLYPSQVEVVDGPSKGIRCWTYQGAVNE